MNGIDVSKIDLNLLVVLHALLSEGSVTRAARRLGIGQPAASHALHRLRAIFSDSLFVRVGREMEPTPRAEALREPLTRLLADVSRLIHVDTAFDPARSSRSFSLVCPDLLAPVLPRLSTKLASLAPAARLEVSLPHADDPRALEEGRVNLALLPHPQQGPGLIRRGLGALRFVVLARRTHPLAGSTKLTQAGWAAYPHVLVRTGHGGQSFVGTELTRARFERRIGLVVPTFISALIAVAETDFFFIAPYKLVLPLLTRFDLVSFEPPIAIPAVPVSAVWHERFQADPAERFFRDLVLGEIEAILRATDD